MRKNHIELACGLIGVGRTWGYKETAIPSEQQASTFLDSALVESIRYFDTAPSYGCSEVRLGNWLSALSQQQRDMLIIATKFGEHWSNKADVTYVDHSYEALKASLDQSILRLGKINVLQLHKTNSSILRSDDLKRAWDYAREKGINLFGASVSDIESGKMVCEDNTYGLIQLPYNQQNMTFAPIIEEAARKGKIVVINRPFNMGEVVNNHLAQNKLEKEQAAFSFILEQKFNGFVLTGTKNPDHLKENVVSFNRAEDKL
jgi:aryl-alcohol dehydrogenase-like predicted oxidoreductase